MAKFKYFYMFTQFKLWQQSTHMYKNKAEQDKSHILHIQ